MEINRENFEAYMLDHAEGSLSAALQQELREFLAMNPDCAPEFEGEKLPLLPHEQFQFPDKNQLKKTIPDASTPLTVNNFDLFSIARMEGDLSDDQVKDHILLMQEQPLLKSEWDHWQQTRLKTHAIAFPGKSKLKKRLPVYRNIRWITVFSTAAAIALITIIFSTGQRDARVMATEDSFTLPRIEESKVEVPVSLPLESQPFLAMMQKRSEEQLPTADHNQVDENTESVEVSTPAPEPAVEEITPSNRPFRAALAANTIPAPVDQGTYDRVRPLQLPQTQVHLRGISLSSLAEMDLQEVVELYAEEKDFSIWSIANAGIRGINKVTGADIALFAARDDDGEISGFQLKSKRLNITTPLQKED